MNPGGEWVPSDSWIVLEQDRCRQPRQPQGQHENKHDKADQSHPDSNWFEESSEDETSPEVRLTHALSLDSMAQAERSLGLAVSLDGIDPEFLKRTSQIIQENARESPNSLVGVESESDSTVSEEFPIKIPVVQKLKYGGRAPPVLGALAPPVNARSSSCVEVGTPKIELPECQSTGKLSKSLMDGMVKPAKRISSPVGSRKDKAGKAERKRSRRRKSHGKKAKWTFYIWGLGKVSLNSVVPIVVSHVFTLLVGIYIGRQYRCCMQSRNSTICQVAHNSAQVPSAVM